MVLAVFRKFGGRARGSPGPKPGGKARQRAFLALEFLEGRVVPAAPCTVQNLSDGVNPVPPNSLRDCLNQANAIPTQGTQQNAILFQQNLSGTITLVQALPPFQQNIDIDGAGASVTVSGNGQVRVFQNNQGKYSEIANLGITAGNAVMNGDGAGVLNTGTLTLFNDSIYGNQGAVLGGGVYNDIDGNLSVQASRIYNNQAIAGGGIANFWMASTCCETSIFNNTASVSGGGIDNGAGSMELQDTAVYYNLADDGGGIANSGVLEIDGGYLTLNTANKRGGGLYNLASGATTANNVEVTDNVATKGGGFYLAAGSLTATGCTLSGNDATTLGAGGCWVQGSTLQLNNCTITDPVVQDPNP